MATAEGRYGSGDAAWDALGVPWELLRSANRILAEYWPQAENLCRICGVVDCWPAREAVSYLEDTLGHQSASAPPAASVEILLRAAVHAEVESVVAPVRRST